MIKKQKKKVVFWVRKKNKVFLPKRDLPLRKYEVRVLFTATQINQLTKEEEKELKLLNRFADYIKEKQEELLE